MKRSKVANFMFSLKTAFKFLFGNRTGKLLTLITWNQLSLYGSNKVVNWLKIVNSNGIVFFIKFLKMGKQLVFILQTHLKKWLEIASTSQKSGQIRVTGQVTQLS